MANNAIQVFDGTPSTVLVGATTTIGIGYTKAPRYVCGGSYSGNDY